MPSGVSDLARALIIFGLLVAVCGLVLLIAPKLPWLGRLPGDIIIQREHFTVYMPLATSLIISLLMSIVWWLFGRR